MKNLKLKMVSRIRPLNVWICICEGTHGIVIYGHYMRYGVQ